MWRTTCATHLEAAVAEGVLEAVVRVVQAVEADAERQPVRVLRALVQPRSGALLLQPPQRLLHHLRTGSHAVLRCLFDCRAARNREEQVISVLHGTSQVTRMAASACRHAVDQAQEFQHKPARQCSQTVPLQTQARV